MTHVFLITFQSTLMKEPHLRLPFGDRMLFLVRLPLTIRGRRIGRGVFRRPRYLAKTPNKTTPADNEANTIYSTKRKVKSFHEFQQNIRRPRRNKKTHVFFYLLCCRCVWYNTIAYLTHHRHNWLVYFYIDVNNSKKKK